MLFDTYFIIDILVCFILCRVPNVAVKAIKSIKSKKSEKNPKKWLFESWSTIQNLIIVFPVSNRLSAEDEKAQVTAAASDHPP